MFRGTEYFQEPWPIFGKQLDTEEVRQHKMKMFHPYVDPENAKIAQKPQVDCFSPPSTMREDHWYRTHGQGIGFWTHSSINHFVLTPEVSPYSDSYSTWDVCRFCWGMMNGVYINWYICRVAAGNLNPLNPRTSWAHRVVWQMGMLRVNLAWLVGCCGYFYAYEFLYTYVPFFRIDDPTPEGWKKVYIDGQSTYMARMVSAVFPALGYVIWKGGFKKSAFWFSFAAWNAFYYEYARFNTFQGTMYFLGFENSLDNERNKKLGQFVPELDRRIDPDTSKPFWVASYKDLRLTHSELQDVIWQYKGHDYCPGAAQGSRFPNPYFNFQKMSQTFYERPILYKTELWQLPNVLSAYTLSGAADK